MHTPPVMAVEGRGKDASADEDQSWASEESKKKLRCKFRKSCYESGEVPVFERSSGGGLARAAPVPPPNLTGLDILINDARLCRWRKSCRDLLAKAEGLPLGKPLCRKASAPPYDAQPQTQQTKTTASQETTTPAPNQHPPKEESKESTSTTADPLPDEDGDEDDDEDDNDDDTQDEPESQEENEEDEDETDDDPADEDVSGDENGDVAEEPRKRKS